MDDGGEATGTWTGQRSEALGESVAHLDAVPDGDGWVWGNPDQARSTSDELVILGVGLLSGGDVFSLWCAGPHGPEAL